MCQENVTFLRIPNSISSVNQILSEEFYYIFNIVEKDLYNVLKNVLDYIYIDNEFLHNILLKFEEEKERQDKIANYLSICNSILNIEINFNELQKKDSYKFITRKIRISYRKKRYTSFMHKKVYYKLHTLKKYIENNEIAYRDILIYNLLLINELPDNNEKNICIYGLQNLFKNEKKYNFPHFLKTLTYLYIYINDKKYYTFEWHDYLIKLFSFCSCKSQYMTYFLSSLKSLEIDKSNFYHRIYVAMNTKSITNTIRSFEKLQSNETQFKLIKEIIDLTNKAKCKIMGISEK